MRNMDKLGPSTTLVLSSGIAFDEKIVKAEGTTWPKGQSGIDDDQTDREHGCGTDICWLMQA